MTKRGRVLRDATLGHGLLMVEGQQYKFSLGELRKSENPPRLGQVVNVEFDADGKLAGITAVSELQLIREDGETTAASTKSGTLATWHFVLTVLTVCGLVGVWFLLATASIDIPILGARELNAWETVAYLNSRNPIASFDQLDTGAAGWYGVAALLSLAGPMLAQVCKNRYAALAGLLPLVFTLVVGIALFVGRDGKNVISFGAGAYLSILLGLFFAFSSAKAFLGRDAAEERHLPRTSRHAA